MSRRKPSGKFVGSVVVSVFSGSRFCAATSSAARCGPMCLRGGFPVTMCRAMAPKDHMSEAGLILLLLLLVVPPLPPLLLLS